MVSGESVEGNKSQREKQLVSAVHTGYVQHRTIVPPNRDIEERGTTNSYRVHHQCELHRAQTPRKKAHNQEIEGEKEKHQCKLASEGRQRTCRLVSRGREGGGGRLRGMHVIVLVIVFYIAG